MASIAEKSFEFTSLFEAEVLVWLMLTTWKHPYANDHDFTNGLLENASLALQEATGGKMLIEGVPPADLNFVAAVWYAEHCAVTQEESDPRTLDARRAWLAAVRHKWPSCFCDPSDLQSPQ